MDKQRARDILLVHSCCSFTNIENGLCMMCPWCDTEDCEKTKINEDMIIEAINTLKGIKPMKKIKLSEIKITSAFENTTPNPEKVQKYREYFEENQKQSKVILLDYDNVLRDGYIQYLVLKENGVNEAEVKISNERKKRWYRKDVTKWENPYYRHETTTYIYGFHPNAKEPKELVWRVPKSWKGWENDLLPGDMIWVNTKYGLRKIVITKIEWLEKCPVDMPVKRVVKKIGV